MCGINAIIPVVYTHGGCKQRKMTNKTIANFFIIISVAIVAIFLIRISIDGITFWNSQVEYDKTGQIGDFIGGVVGTVISAAGFYFLYLTFNEQRKSFEREQLENRFFELIKLHRDNVSELRFDATKLCEDDDSLFIEKNIYEGKSVFKVIFNQFIICRNELNGFMRKSSMFLPEYEKELSENPFVKENKIDIVMLARIDVCFSIVFYGLSSEGRLVLRNSFSKRYKQKFIDD